MASNNGHISHYTAIKETQHCHCHNSENKVVWQCLGVSFFTGQNLFTARVWSRHTTQPSRKPNIVIIQIINVPKAPRHPPRKPIAEETLIFWKSLPTGIRSGGNSIGVSMQPCNTIIKPSITVRQSTLPFFLPFPLPFSLPFVLPFSLPKNKYII